MADDFNLFDPEHIQTAPIPEQDVPDVPLPQETPVRRPNPRRRRRRRPAWQRLLWKYWPPIRLGLMVIAGILMIWLIVSAFGGGCQSQIPDPTDPPHQTDPTDMTTEPPTEPATEPPTEPPTEAPTDPPPTDPFAGGVEDSWYDNALFIGDFNISGLRDNGRKGEADYFTSSGMGVFNYDDQELSDRNFEKTDLAGLLASQDYEKIILNLGINNCGYTKSSLVNAYGKMVQYLRETEPDAKIIIHAILPVTSSYAANAEYFEADYIQTINEELKALADGENVFYIDCSEYFLDNFGYLQSAISTDGCHLKGTSYQDWATLISVAVAQLNID